MKSASSLRYLVALLALAAIGLSGLYGVNLLRGHAQLRVEVQTLAERRAIQLSDAKASELEALFRGVDASLQQFREAYARSGPAAAERTATSAIQAYPHDALAFFSVIDADGRVVMSTAGASRQQAGSSDDWIAHRLGTADDFRMGRPTPHGADGSWVVVLTRPRVDDGQFAGVVEVGVSIGFLADRLAQLELDQDDVVSVFFRDGRYLARSRDWQSVMNQALPSDRPFLVPGAPESGFLWVKAVSDHQERLYAWRRLDNLPLFLTIGLKTSTLMAPVEAQIADSRSENAAAIAAVLSLMLGAGWLLLKNARQQEELLDSETLMRSTLEATSEGMVVVDQAGQVLLANPRFVELLGLPAKTSAATEDIAFEVVFEQLAQPESARRIWRAWDEGDQGWHATFDHKDGRVLQMYPRAFDLSGRRVRLCCFRDVTESRRREAELKALATTDALTGLPNRRQFMTRLTDEMNRVRRIDGYGASLLMLDIDHFKQINDSQGHMAGDAILQAFAGLLAHDIRTIDMAGRLGGEEFGVILPLADADAARRYAERLRQNIHDAPLGLDLGSRGVTVSIGVTRILPTDSTAEMILNRADQALYVAKRKGRDRVEVAEDAV
jgi:diguanylate cyclase (GGDEF)-like protein/PAS domain S-box-containing protein